MKTFIYSVTVDSNKGGSRQETATIYRVKNNVPDYITTVSWNTGSYMGSDTVVMHTLSKLGKLPKSEGYYIENNKFRIVSI